MKKHLNIGLLIVFAAFVGSSTQAQISVGLKGGLNVSNLNGIDADNYKTTALLGFHVGGYTTFNLGRHFAIHPELMYSTQGAKLEDATNEENLRMNYINIPVLVRLLTTNGFFVEAGPQLGFKVDEANTDDIENSVKNADFEACLGLGFQPTKKPFGIGARYNLGLGKAGEINSGTPDNIDYKNGVFQLSIYWRILGGGKLKK
jgi:hypothetical protein